VAGVASQAIICKGSDFEGTAVNEYEVSLTDTEALFFAVNDASVPRSGYRQTSSPLSVGWHHVVCTYSGVGGATVESGMNIYVDGVLATMGAPVARATYVAMENLAQAVGVAAAYTGSYPFKGDMGRLFVTGEALSAATVWKMYEKTRGYYNK
jgi:hypothetical protein